MKSAGHRANLLNCATTTVGVGAVYATNGNPYYTQDFGYCATWYRARPRGPAAGALAAP
jgi:hypothetical protein